MYSWKKSNPVCKRWLIRHIITMTLYTIVLPLANLAYYRFHPVGILLILLSIAPALPIIAMLAAFGIYLAQQPDEFVRSIDVQCSLWATGLLLGFVTAWGFLQEAIPHLYFPLYWLFVGWWIIFGITKPILYWRYR